jgi:hypothetical protein
MTAQAWGYIGMSAIAYAVCTSAGAIPDWAHIVAAAFIVTVLLASSYPDDLAAISKLFRGASEPLLNAKPLSKAEPLSKREARAVRVRFAQARRNQVLRRQRFKDAHDEYAQGAAQGWSAGSEPHASGHARRA